MPEYSLKIKRSAEREFNKLPHDISVRIAEKIILLEKNPRPSGCKKLINMDGYRIRVGDYRILYTVDNKTVAVEIYAIAHRKDTYR